MKMTSLPFTSLLLLHNRKIKGRGDHNIGPQVTTTNPAPAFFSSLPPLHPAAKIKAHKT